ncbi:MAG: protein kinase [Cocleimonas sp.]|nr:protein kinase [Cocleimonas sp.]
MKNKTITLNNDTYTVLEALGKGGQASVWKVRRHRDNKALAMKTVLTVKKTERGRTERLTEAVVKGLSQRLQSEIDFIQSLPNTRKCFIVPCLDHGQFDDAEYGLLPILVMPLYKQTLDSKMPPYPKDKPIPVLFSDCLKWIEQAAIALEATHSFSTGSTRFVHRDVKASNLMLTQKDDIRLIDFGIVRETTLDTETGTHSYSTESAAPEQVLPNSINAGKSTYAIGTHSDMYALGSVFYYLFSGKQSEAQQELVKKDFYDQHILKLQNEGNTGEIGQVGGLTDDEYGDLLDQIHFRFDEEYTDPDASIISVETGILQSGDYIPRSVAKFIRALLDPVYHHRPSAAQMRLWCQSIKQALSPQLSELKLSITEKQLSPNMPITVNLSMIGKGLPANADWIELTVNGEQVYTGFKPLAQDKHYFGFAKAEQTSWQFEVSTKEKARFLELNVKALVNDRSVQDALKVKINETADDLWQQGKHKQALCIELRQNWLDELHQGCDSFMDAAAHSELLRSLQNCQPKQHEMIALYQQKLEHKFNPNAKTDPITEPVVEPEKIEKKIADPIRNEKQVDATVSISQDKPSSWKKYIAFAAAVFSISAAGYFMLGSNKPPVDPANSDLSYSSPTTYTPSVPDIPANHPEPIDTPTDNPDVDVSDIIDTPASNPKPSSPVVTTRPITPEPINKAEKELATLKIQITSNNKSIRNKAWKRLNQLSRKKNDHQAKKILTNFVKQTFKLAASSNQNHQKQAFERLNLIAKSGDKNAMKSLGRAYYKGRGTHKNWAQSWALLNQASAGNEKDKLELDANAILHNKKSTVRERHFAYQAAEITAKNEDAGDPAQKWMVYRYSIGDGVPVNKEKAQYWQNIYDGK